MCGIAGGFHLEQRRLSAMLEAMSHRGPDGCGSFYEGCFAFGMRRLSIMDPDRGGQPFQSDDGRYQVLCNGEIYNWRELRRDLELCGHVFRTECDGEIIPAAWMEWGTGMLGRLNGMFALAVFDRDTKVLHVARDRCGQKPLYVTKTGPFRFASEVKGLRAAGVSLEPDPMRLGEWLSLRYVPGPGTMYRHIDTLPAGHWMSVREDGERELVAYWRPVERPEGASAGGTVDALDQLVRSSVGLALQADVSFAAYLSGGVDSALLLHYIRDAGVKVNTVSIGFGAGSDETADAAAFSRLMGMEHHSFQLRPEALGGLPRVIGQMECPVGDGLILAFDALALHTKALGCKVALGGEGPDEHFAGYSFQKAYLTALRLGPLGRKLAAAALAILPSSVLDALAQFPAEIGAEGRAKVRRYLLDFSKLHSTARHTSLRTLFEPEMIRRLIPADYFSGHMYEAESALFVGRPLAAALAEQYSSWLPDWSLIRQDKNSMAHSVEYRAPFLDHRIIDFAFTLPDSAKICRGVDKVIWRELAARHLPCEVTKRPKQPFYLPLEQAAWRKALVALARDTLTKQSVDESGWLNYECVETFFSATTFLPLKQLAALVILQLWLAKNTTST